MTKMTPERIAAAEKRIQAAKPKEDWASHRINLTTTPEGADGAKIWYDDGDLCAIVHSNLGLDYHADDYAELFAASVQDLPDAIADIKSLQSENNELRSRLDQAMFEIFQNAMGFVEYQPEGWLIGDSDAGDYLVSRGLAEKHPEKNWYRLVKKA